MRKRRWVVAACGAAMLLARASFGAVVINEFQYDDLTTASGVDTREFIEIYNNGGVAVDISGWTIGGRDNGTTNSAATVPAATMLPAGGYYVFGNTGVQNVNQVIAANFIENDAETMELRNGPFATGVLQDAVVYEANKGATVNATSYGTLPADVAAKINVGGNANSPGYWANSQAVSTGTSPNASVTASVARIINGVDTSNNGRDFGMRPATPGASNAAGGSIIVNYTPADVDSLTVGDNAPGLQASFVGGAGLLYTVPAGIKVIDPTVVSTFNQNAIPASPQGGKAITLVDTSGGGNAAVSVDVHQGAGTFNIAAYLDTSDLLTATAAETTTYGTMGSIGTLFNIPDPEGDISVATAPGSAGDNTGVAWLYQKFGNRAKLYLVDAGDGGNSSPDVSPVEWAIIKSYDLSLASSGWHQLAISVDALGNGLANFDGDLTGFTTAPNLSGEFYVGYREAVGPGTPGAPGAGEIYRPPTFDITTNPIPEPTSLAAIGLAGLVGLRRRR